MRTLTIIIALSLSIIWTSVFAQPGPQTFSNRADSLMNEGNVPEAIAEYRRLDLPSTPEIRKFYIIMPLLFQ